MKRCPGQNWGAALTPGSPNLSDAGSSAFCTADKPIFKIEEVLLNYAEAIKADGKASAYAEAGGWIYKSVSPLDQGGGWLDTYYLMMVPTNEIALNPQLTQNPGYNELFGL